MIDIIRSWLQLRKDERKPRNITQDDCKDYRPAIKWEKYRVVRDLFVLLLQRLAIRYTQSQRGNIIIEEGKLCIKASVSRRRPLFA
nr:hypothetical protein [Prevotella disiens]